MARMAARAVTAAATDTSLASSATAWACSSSVSAATVSKVGSDDASPRRKAAVSAGANQ